MFKLAANPTFNHVVKVHMPVDGGHDEQTFKATFRVLSTDAAAAFDFLSEAGTRDFLVEAVVGVADVIDEATGKALPYNDALRDRLIGLPYVRQALLNAYLKGVAGAAAGN